MAYGMSKIALEHMTVCARDAAARTDRIPVNTFRIDVPVASRGLRLQLARRRPQRLGAARGRGRGHRLDAAPAARVHRQQRRHGRAARRARDHGRPMSARRHAAARRHQPRQPDADARRSSRCHRRVIADVHRHRRPAPDDARHATRSGRARLPRRERGAVEPAARARRVRGVCRASRRVVLVGGALPARAGSTRSPASGPATARARPSTGRIPAARRSRSPAATAPRASCCTSSCTGRWRTRARAAVPRLARSPGAARRDARVLRARARRAARSTRTRSTRCASASRAARRRARPLRYGDDERKRLERVAKRRSTHRRLALRVSSSAGLEQPGLEQPGLEQPSSPSATRAAVDRFNDAFNAARRRRSDGRDDRRLRVREHVAATR